MANFIPEQEKYKKLTPFKLHCLTQFPYIDADFDALTNWELLCKVSEYLNNVISNENAVESNVTGLHNAFVSLQNYINDYFDNLDVQEEVNNKLDSMAEDGTLYELIERFTNPIMTEQNNKIEQIEIKVNSVASGSPANTYSTLSALQSADPDHSKIYVVEADGEWYFWNTQTNQWKNGGVYQATSIADGSVTPEKTSFMELSTENLWTPQPSVANGVTIGFTNDGATTISGTVQTNAFRQTIFKTHLDAGTYSLRAFEAEGVKPAIYGHKTDTTGDIAVTIGANDYGKVFTLDAPTDVYFKTYEVINASYNYSGKIVLTKINRWQDIVEYVKPYYVIKKTNVITNKDLATYTKNGIARPDGQTIFINDDGLLSTTGTANYFAGKKLSICGISVDTFQGYIPSGNATYYSETNLGSVENTWWKKVINRTGMDLLVNNSWSGATATTQQNLASSGVQRCLSLDNGISNPDFIIVGSFGLNDWLKDTNYGNYNVTTQIPDINVDLTNTNNYNTYKAVIETYEGALATMFKRMQQKYPDAKILAMDMYPYYRQGANPIGDNNRNVYTCNESLYKIAKMFGVQVIKISTCGINSINARNYCVEGISSTTALHPNANGHTMLYKEVMKALNKYTY